MNKVILLGRLTKDPDVRYSQGANAGSTYQPYTNGAVDPEGFMTIPDSVDEELPFA